MRNYVKYLGVFIVFFALILLIEYANQYTRMLFQGVFDYSFINLVRIIGWLVFGLFLGGLNLIYEANKIGIWKVNKEKLLVLGIPLFIVLVLYCAAYFGVTMPNPIERLLLFILTKKAIEYFAIFLGFTLTSSLTKQ